jgi:hypothetical protein
MLVEKARDENIKLNIYHFLELVDGKLKYVVYDRDDAFGAMKGIGIDLRRADEL